jgi:hypothetical protein
MTTTSFASFIFPSMRTSFFQTSILACAFVVSVGVAAFAQEKVAQPVENKTATKTPAAEPAKTQAVDDKGKGGTMSASAPRGYKISGKSRPIRGVVINLTEYLATGKGTVNAAQAADAQQKGATLALLAGTGRSAKVYLVSKSDGSSAAADLARLADNSVGVVGKTVTRSGVMLLVADVIDTMK